MSALPSDTSSSDDDLQRLNTVFDAQRRAFAANPYLDVDTRILRLEQLRASLCRNIDAISDAVKADFGQRASAETKLLELIPCVDELRHVADKLHKWAKPSKRRIHVAFQPGAAKVFYQPLGVVGIIVPWNFPFLLSLGPLITALAAGNNVMLKMSEDAPHSAQLLKTLLAEIFSEDQVAVILGGSGTGIAFSQLPFDHLLFTGSTGVGRKVMQAAAVNLTPVTLELGGKSPAIVHDSFPMRDAAERICFGKSLNAGQACVAVDYVLVPKNREEEFVAQFTDVVKKWYPSLLDNDDYTAIINARQQQRLQRYLEDAEAKGATLVTLNPADECFNDSLKMPITLLRNTDSSMLVEQEELFGPLLVIKTYDNFNDALDYVNERPRPLALYYFDLDEERQEYVINNTRAGGGCINETLLHVGSPDLPFGGIGPSGMGSYHGHEGFLQFSKARGIVQKGAINSTKLVYPPFNTRIQRALFKMLLR